MLAAAEEVMDSKLRSMRASRTQKRARRWLCLMSTVMCASCDKPPQKEDVHLPAVHHSQGGGLGDGGFDVSDAAVAIDAGALGCGMPPATDTKFTKQALLTSFAQCATLQFCEFTAFADELARKADAYSAQPDAEHLAQVKDAWYAAELRWQRLELFRFGPAALPSTDPAGNMGGLGLRNEIYDFPDQAWCDVEQLIAYQKYQNGGVAKSEAKDRGFAALEYMLFNTGTDNTCVPIGGINSDGSWPTSAKELAKRKALLAGPLADVIRSNANKLFAAWDPHQDNFSKDFATAGHGSKLFMSEQGALNAVGAALFYLDREVKDFKLARPAGLTMTCSADCGTLVESPYARRSKDFIQANLQGFRMLFQGCGENYAGLGFDDWLVAAGAGDLAKEISSKLDAADKAAALNGRLEDALAKDLNQVIALHTAIKDISDLLKSQFISTLHLQVPVGFEGDND